ncbi:hypothetical protein N7481_009646 [Penicillium waksmanii]|uniref:uncharacterized protein n=1 Tax=Penicillium waksmanii TaxID=69791 RepID=UPI002547ADCA|nr:uncharacterized protein N7481_009646 [Penicillium waksmanii]KAJ5975939.1 hypothetical protein N7481_009646 [Penicillium waksmanii]
MALRLSRHAPQLRCTRSFSTSPRSARYSDTLPNLKIGAHTRVLFQGFTGRQATANVKESLEWGTKIVGGVKPGVEGEHLGLPVFPLCEGGMCTTRNGLDAQEKSKPDASAIYVPGNQTAQAIEEAIEAEIPLVVAVAEHVPIHDILRIHSMLQTQSKTRLVGANCPGIISAIGKCRIGFQPLPCFAPGNVGIVAKSGTLSYETVASTTRAGLGQSLCISMGGDVLAGTNFVDALKIFEHDDDTHGIILVGEIGGVAEMDAAEWIKDYRKRTASPKPIMALVGGLEAPAGRIMGHAGAWAAPGEPDAQTKYQALERAGAVMGGSGIRPGASDISVTGSGKRGFHTMRRVTPASRPVFQQNRSLYIKQFQAFDLLKEKGVLVNGSPYKSDASISISVDRTSLSPCIVASPTADFDPAQSRRFPFTYSQANFDGNHLITQVTSHLGLPASAQGRVSSLVQALWDIFREKEAFVLETQIGTAANGGLEVHTARFGFDDAAFRSSGRQEGIHRLRNTAEEVPAEIEAEKDGIVYIRLEGEGSVGTLVNGAGLAMNTVDALTIHGGHCANFLDTGGKATSETVKSSFRVICADPRVKAIFVNIFGGLTRCDMIAEGIILAFRDLNMQVPVVVRLRGTNEELGQKMIAESGLPLHAFDGFEEAAKKVITLARTIQYYPIAPSTFNMLSNREHAIFEKEGAQLRRWMENPSEPGCYIPRARMFLSDLMDTYEMDAPEIKGDIGLKPLSDPSEGPELQQFQSFHWFHQEMQFDGHATPSSLTIEIIRKPADRYFELPPISEVAKALYEDSFALDGLEHIFVKNIQNYETKRCLENFILPNHPPVPDLGSLTLNRLESDAILGSRIGKVVAYFVLSALSFFEIRTGDI